ncbi:MAG: phospho-N-acetylmuramoyl-pentapeptide-transferase [Clostridia bacterium]|nr:phospho-N-acetylmuramoyl-pentapeptide-transferase [Clostridia bacterium]
MNVESLYTALALFAMTFLLTVVFSHFLIPILRRHRAGQPILEIGPSWHLSKAGTPTLGGLAFIVGIGGALLLYAIYLLLTKESNSLRALSLIFIYGVLCGAIGFFDDYRKLVKKENQGLSAPQKYLLLLLASALFLFASRVALQTDTSIALPFADRSLELGVFYYPLALLYLTGLVNALNLTDGVDGLLSSTVAVVATFFLLWGYSEGEETAVIVGALLLGATLGFLCFNAHPAKVFMGDTGSLFFGGVVSAVGIVTEHPVLVLLSCGVFVIEAGSVILQVIFFKLSHGKRLFRMAPLHHHFEKCGWSEWRVVAVFSAVGALFSAVAFLGR